MKLFVTGLFVLVLSAPLFAGILPPMGTPEEQARVQRRNKEHRARYLCRQEAQHKLVVRKVFDKKFVPKGEYLEAFFVRCMARNGFAHSKDSSPPPEDAPGE